MKKKWIELSQTYLTDTKKRPIEALLFVNHCTYNPDAKTPVLRRRVGIRVLTGDTKREINEEVTRFASQRGVRLLANGLESNDYRRLPSEVRNPPKDVVRGTAPIYTVPL